MKLLKQCPKWGFFFLSVLIVFGCTEKIYELIKRDFENELIVLKSSNGDRFTECEKALNDKNQCFHHFFKEERDCDDFKVFMGVSNEGSSNTSRTERKIRRLKKDKPRRGDFDDRDDYREALEEYREDLDDLEDDLNDPSGGGDQNSIKAAYAKHCQRALKQVDYICGDENTTLNSELASAIETIRYKISNQGQEDLHDHCDMEWKPYTNN